MRPLTLEKTRFSTENHEHDRPEPKKKHQSSEVHCRNQFPTFGQIQEKEQAEPSMAPL